MRIVSVPKYSDETPAPFEVSYILIGPDEVVRLLESVGSYDGGGIKQASLHHITLFPSFTAALDVCTRECMDDMYIARIEIVAKTV